MSDIVVPVIMGSKSDLSFAERIAAALGEFGLPAELRIASAHKSVQHLLEMLATYEADGRLKVYITVAGRSNALSGLVDANVTAPVIACPPYSEKFGGLDVLSSLRMPSGVAPAVVLEPEAAALLAAKILGLAGARRPDGLSVREVVAVVQAGRRDQIRQDDAQFLSDDKPREACGVFGIYAPGEDVARLSFFALYALQHRGQESAGIATCDGQVAHIHKGMGLVAQVFTEENLHPLRGHLAVGHNRYSTTGGSRLRNAQPYLIETALGPLGVAHNGNLVNAPQLRRELLQRGVGLSSSTDSEVITQMLAGGWGDWGTRIRGMMAQAHGAYALTILTRDAVYGVRDPWGFRPLCVGRLNGGGYCLASESCALWTIGAEFVREAQPGEIVRLDGDGMTAEQGAPPRRPALCTFEHIYFARPDSLFDGRVIHEVRQALGRELAREAPVEADLVVGVPDSGTPHAIGYAQASGIPYSEGLIKNRYIGRTFIQPSDRLRKAGVNLKYNPLPGNLTGKRIVMVDDSIVRGNTAGPLVDLLRQAGASEVHVRVACPPIKHPCFMGVDMARDDELIASSRSIDEIRDHIGADSLAYLSIDGMMRAVGVTEGYCNACFTGVYPIRLEEQQDKRMFERVLDPV